LTSIKLISTDLFSYDGSSFLSSVEVFDATVKQWTALRSMTTRRSRVGVAVVGIKLYAVGGYNGLSNLSTVEQYDTEHDEWHLVTPMTIHQGGVGVGVLPRI
jgi:kelch-like protein 18